MPADMSPTGAADYVKVPILLLAHAKNQAECHAV